MAVDLSATNLLGQYREFHQLEIERLLRQYDTSLSSMREMYPLMTSAIEKTQLAQLPPTKELLFNPSEAAEMGLSLQEGWTLKFTPQGEDYGVSFVTPSKWEITETGEYISPEGTKYSKADLEALLSPPAEGIEATPTPLTIEALTPEGQAEYQAYQQAGGQLDVVGWVNLRQQQYVETEQIFGKVFPDQSLQEVIDYIQTNPEGFQADMRELGWNTDTEALLRNLMPEITTEDLQAIFGVTAPYVPESAWKDFRDAVWAGAMGMIQNIETFLFTNPAQRLSQEQAASWTTSVTPIMPLQIDPAIIGKELAATFPKPNIPYVPEAQYQQLAQQTLEGYLRRREQQRQYWIDHPELVPNPEYLKNPFQNPGLFLTPGYWSYSIGSSLAYSLAVMGTIVGVSAVATPAVGIPAGVLMATMPEAGAMLDQLRSMGVPIEEARQKAFLGGLIAGGVEAISDIPFIGLVFKPLKPVVQPLLNTIQKVTTNALAKAVITGLTVPQIEGLEEAVTQLAQNAIFQQYDKTQSLLEGVSQAYIQAVIASVPFGAIGGMASYQTFRSKLSPETGQKLDTLVNKLQTQGLTEEQAQVQAVNELARDPEIEPGLSKAIEAAQLEYLESQGVKSVEELIPDQGIAGDILNEIKIAEQIKPTKRVTLTPTQYGEGLYAINIEGREGSVGGIVAIPQGDSLFVNRISIHEKGVLTRSLLRIIDEQLIAMAQQKGLRYIKIASKPETIALYSRAGYVQEAGTNIMVKEVPGVPVTPPGMPEAGLQAGIPGMAAAEIARPQPTGRLVQARIDDYLRLREYNKQAVADRIAEIKKTLQQPGRSEIGTKGTLRLELARLEALQELDGVESVTDLDSLMETLGNEIRLRDVPYGGYFGQRPIEAARHPQKRLYKGYTLKQMEEMMRVYQEAREGMKAEVPPLKPTAKPEPTPAQVNRVKADPTPASDEIVIKKFIDCIKDAKPATEETLALRHKELQRRSAIFASILQGGEGYHAFEQAKAVLKGPLPKAEWDLDLQKFGITDAEIVRMFDRIRLDEKLQPFQKLNTYEALTNLLAGATLTESEISLLEKVFGSRLAVALIGKWPTRQRVVRILQDITNVPRTLVTIADLSASFRQGAMLAFGQPVQFSEAFVAQLKAVFSETNFKLIDETVHNNAYVASGKLRKLYIAPIEEAVHVEAREEAFRGRLIEKIPILGSVIRASERAYITFLNVLRVSVGTYYARQWEGTGKTQNDYDKLCDFINHATGRGDLGAFTQAGSWLSATFFSPRYIMSRIQVPLDLINTTPAVRKVIARNLVAFVGTGMLALFLARLAGAETEDDPRSADFGKIKIGNTRIDFWAGYLPYVRLIAQIISEERKSTKTGEVYKIDPIDVGVNFFRSKLAPFPGFLWDLKAGETFIGEELSAENAEKIIFEKLVPMFIQDLIEAVKDSGLAAGIGYGLLSGLGVGIQTYSDNWGSAELKLGLPVRSENFPYTIENEVYDVKDYYSEISGMIGGATYDMLKDKNVPELVLSVARAKDVLREIDLLPNKRLININADSTKGDTFEQYRVQWLAREKIANAEELKQFDKDYPDAFLGNITQAQYALLVEYHSLPDADKAAFLGNHPELYANPREEWLRTHPQENALLALWGKAEVYSGDALSKVSTLSHSLGIPENALTLKDLSQVAELKLKNQSLFDLVEAYGGLDDTLRGPDGLTARDRAINQVYLDNPAFRDDQRRIEALGVGTETNPTPSGIVELWVERGQIADDFGSSSAEMKLWLIDNKEVHQWALENALLSDNGEGWNEDILRLQVNYSEDFQKYDDYGDITSPLYISDGTARVEAREGMLFDNKGMTAFGVAHYTIDALQKDIPDNLVPTYVEYYGIRKKEGVDYSAGWYEDDWYLLEHEDFYDTMISLGEWQERDFTKVPSRAVFSLYKTYMGLPKGDARLDFRAQHLDLDAWLVLAKGYTAVGNR